MRRGDRDADSVASGDSKRSWGMGRGVTPIGDAASGRSARGDAVSESAASASSTGSWMRKGTRRLASPPQSAVDPLRSNARGAPRAVSRFARSDGTIESSNDVSRIVFVNHHHHHRSIRRRIESIAVALERKRLTETRAHRERAFTPPVTDRVSPIAEFGFKPRVLTDSDPASPKRAPHASASRRDAAAAAAVDFEVRENARLALELKQEELVKLRRRLSATEEALREGAERNAELETRLSEREGREVEAEAAALNSSLAAAMRDVRGFFSAGGKVDAAKTDQSHKDARGNARAFANGQSHDHGVLRSGLKKSASKSRASRDGGSTDANERRGVTFLAESEQKRLEEEGGYVAKLRVKTAENEDLEARLLASETSLERKREQMRVAKASYEALQKRLEEETRRREAAERALDDSAKSRVAVSDGPNEHATKATKTKHLLRDVLALTAHACGVTGRADSRAITAALPALAALARAGPGESARELLTETRVLEHITDAFETHEDDAAVAASVCATLAALVAGARAAGGRDEKKGVFQSNGLAARSGARLARVVSRALAKHRSSPEACACACDLMRALASERDDVSETLTSELVRLGSASGAVGAAEWHPSDEDVVLAAARALVSMVEHGTARDARLMARCGAAGVVRRAERHGLDTGLRRAGRAVESWARENAENAANAADADEETKDENAAAPRTTPRTTPRRRAAIPEEAAYEGSGFKPRVASQSWRERGRRDANGDADAAYGNGGDRTNPDAADVSEDDFDDAQFDDKL